MTYSINVSASTISVVLSESIDLSCTAALKEEFERLMSSDVHSVQINAERVEYIDSSGVASLLFVRKLCANFGANLVISAISVPAARVIQLANLDAVLGLPKAIPLSSPNKPSSLASMPVFSDEDAMNIFKNDHSKQ
jgi:anti-sigma B factor antagonist